MAVFRRPELEKDNPLAPQMYVGPRRRHALTRAASMHQVTPQESVAEAIQRLTVAAERFVAVVPPVKRSTQERKALLKAITLAHKSLAEVSRDELGVVKNSTREIEKLKLSRVRAIRHPR